MADRESSDNMFQLTISGNGVSVERMIDGQTLTAIMPFVMEVDKQTGGAAVSGSISSSSVDDAVVPISLREFLDEAHAKRKPDQIVTIGHYVMQFEGQDDFSRDDVKARFSVAREPMPANFSRDFAFAERNGMIAKVHGKEGRYYITKVGLGSVQNKFSKTKSK